MIRMQTKEFPFYNIATAARMIGITGARLRQMLLDGTARGHKLGDQARGKWAIPEAEVTRLQSLPQTRGRPRKQAV